MESSEGEIGEWSCCDPQYGLAEGKVVRLQAKGQQRWVSQIFATYNTHSPGTLPVQNQGYNKKHAVRKIFK